MKFVYANISSSLYHLLFYAVTLFCHFKVCIF